MTVPLLPPPQEEEEGQHAEEREEGQHAEEGEEEAVEYWYAYACMF